MHGLLESVNVWRLTTENDQTNTNKSTTSRATAVSQSTELLTTSLSYEHAIFRRTQNKNPWTDQYEVLRIKTSYFGDITKCAKNGWNRLAGGSSADR